MPSHEVDNRCYWQAAAEVMKVELDTLSLDSFSNVTDNGIWQEWVQTRFGRAPGPDESLAMKRRFLKHIQHAAKHEPAAFKPVAGVRRWLRYQQSLGHEVAIATGGWGHTAACKLKAAGLDDLNLVLASSNDGTARIDIMLAALKKLAINQPDSAHATTGQHTYIGDSPWDLAAARQLGWRFIGIGTGERAARLRQSGAQRVARDFTALL